MIDGLVPPVHRVVGLWAICCRLLSAIFMNIPCEPYPRDPMSPLSDGELWAIRRRLLSGFFFIDDVSPFWEDES